MSAQIVQSLLRDPADIASRCEKPEGMRELALTSLAKRRTKPPSNSSSSRSGFHAAASPGPISATPCRKKTSA